MTGIVDWAVKNTRLVIAALIVTIVAGSPLHLVPGGWLLLEHGYDQAAAVRTLLLDAGFTEVQSWQDLAGIERVSGGRFGV